MKEKKILVVITTGFTSWGGLTTVFMNYYRAMDKENLLIDVASMNEAEQELVQEIADNGGKYIKFTDKRKNPIRYYQEYWKICKDYDVVHIHGNSPTMAGELYMAKVKKIPIRIAHNHTTQGKHPILNILLSPAFRHSYTVGIACSKQAGDWLYKTKNYKVMKNTIEVQKYGFKDEVRGMLRRNYNIESNDIVYGHVGKFVDQKNHIFLLDVFERIHRINPQTKLLLVGDGDLRETIERKIEEHHLQTAVILVGMQKDASSFYSAMDIFLFPSKIEGFGLALLEAQCSGLRCIASDKVSREVNVTNQVEFLALEKQIWVEKIENLPIKKYKAERKEMCDIAKRLIFDSEFDYMSNSLLLRNIYLGVDS